MAGCMSWVLGAGMGAMRRVSICDFVCHWRRGTEDRAAQVQCIRARGELRKWQWLVPEFEEKGAPAGLMSWKWIG